MGLRILGIDPGSRHCGFGVLEHSHSQTDLVEAGVIDVSNSLSFEDRLLRLGESLQRILTLHRPSQVAIERVFLGKNADSAFKLGHARGICIFVAKSNGAKVFEYSAKTVKKCITGTGSADKELVQTMVMRILNIQLKMLMDASDALAIAITHARELDLARVLDGRAREARI